MYEFLLLCLNFFKTGLLAVGGGLATLPFLADMSNHHPEWFTHTDLANMVAIAESTPGPIGVNMATYAGYATFGIPGALGATLSLVFPSAVVILLVYQLLEKFKSSKLLDQIFKALRPASTGLILAAFLTLAIIIFFPDFSAGSMQPDLIGVIFFVGFFILMQLPKVKNLHPILFILAGAVIGIVAGL